MARAMPAGMPDYTTQIAAREAAANDALARLFYTLMARREERERTEQLRRDMQLQQQGFTAEQNQLNRDWRTDLEYNKPSMQQQPSYLAPGSGGRRMAPTAAAPTAPASKLAPGAPGAGGFRPGSVGPNPNKFSSTGGDNVELAGSFPSPFEPDESAGETVTLSGQAVQRPERLPATRRSNAPVGTTPQPRQSRRPRQTAQGQWGPIDEQYTAAWDAAEKKYNLPKGLLQTMVGVQHNYGRDDGGDAGWYRMAPDLKQAWGVTPEMSKDLVAMSDVMGKNMARNRDAYNRYVDQYNTKNKTNIPKLSNSAADVPVHAILNQFGVVNGPRVVVSAYVNNDTPLAPQMAPEKGVDPSRQLVTMGLPATATGRDLFGNNNGIGKRATDTHQTTIQHQENPPSADDESAPIPPRGVGTGDPYSYLESRGGRRVDVRSLKPEFATKIAASMQEAEAATGARASINNAYRSPEEQAQIRSNARGVPVTYNGVRYTPQPGPRGYPVAPPGQSRHGAGTAMDLNAGPVRDYMRQPDQLKKHGLSTIRNDAPHIQMAGGPTPQIARGDRSGAPTQQSEPPAEPPVAVAAKPTDPTEGLERTPMFMQRPITQPKTAQVDTFGTKASPPLATMQPGLKGALAGAIFAPKMQFAEESPIQIPNAPVTPTVVPKTAAIPDEVTAGANQSTPQTRQTVEQVTQASPTATPTPTPIPPDGGYTADDPDERAATRLSADEQIPTPQPRPQQQTLLGGRSLRDLPESVTVPPPGDVLETLGQGARDIRSAADDLLTKGGEVAGDIGWAAGDIVSKAGEAARDIRSVDPMSDIVTAAGDIGGDIVSGAGQVARDIRSYDPMSDVVQGAGDLVKDVSGKVYDAFTNPGTPSYNVPPQVQRMMEQQVAQQKPPVSTQQPLPVEASKVAEAMFDTNTEGVPSYTGPSLSLPNIGIPGREAAIADTKNLMDMFKRFFTSKKDEAHTVAAPIPVDKQMPPPNKVRAREVLPSGEELYPDQPPQVIPPKRAPPKETVYPTVPGVTPGAKTIPSAIPSRKKYDPNAPKVYDYDPNTKKSIIVPQQGEPVDQIAPNADEEEQ